MTKALLWAAGGVLLGLMIHLVVILTLPNLAPQDLWSRIVERGALQKVLVLDPVEAGAANPLALDPHLLYAICQLDLRQGPGVVTGTLPDAFWSVSVFNRMGVAIYSTTNRAGTGNVLRLGVFDPAQTRLLAEQQFVIEEGLLIVESTADDVFVAVRLAPAHPVMRDRYRESLEGLDCGNIEIG